MPPGTWTIPNSQDSRRLGTFSAFSRASQPQASWGDWKVFGTSKGPSIPAGFLGSCRFPAFVAPKVSWGPKVPGTLLTTRCPFNMNLAMPPGTWTIPNSQDSRRLGTFSAFSRASQPQASWGDWKVFGTSKGPSIPAGFLGSCRFPAFVAPKVSWGSKVPGNTSHGFLKYHSAGHF